MPQAHVADRPGPPAGWPRPPFDWPYRETGEAVAARACSIDTTEGRWLQAFTLDVDPAAPEWRIGPKVAGPFVSLSLARVARVTLGAPMQASGTSADALPASLPSQALECDYVLRVPDGRDLLRGRTLGHVETDAGVFLFAPQPGGLALQRVFVPRAARLACRFGPTAGELAASRWITDPTVLRAALSGQRGKRMPRIGEALARLGFATPQVIEQVLAQGGTSAPLGERLVQQGLLTPEQLEIALAFKLGYPLVDLARFPVDASCACMLPPELARRHVALPILLDGRRVVVAVEGPATVAALEALDLWPGRPIAPVFAPRGAILLAASMHRGDDAWSQEVPWR